jgi:predicted Zn-dependent peptidase
MMMSLESSSNRCEQLGRQIHIFGRPLSLSEIVANIDSVDRDSVIKVAERLFRGSQPVVAALGPIERLEPYAQIAARFA